MSTGPKRLNQPLRIIEAIRGSLRYKLLVLVLFPILLIMPIALGLAIYWGSQFSYEQLFIKVNTDLSVAEDNFHRLQEDYLNTLGRLAESYAFYTALESKSGLVVNAQLAELQQSAGFSYLHLLGVDGKRLFLSYGEAEKRGHSSP
ncbi:MAG: hypothetical protein AB2734_10000, partial [Candidatus Thiodiazotropha endolucinida]